MNNIPDWLWHAWDVPDLIWKGLAVWATGEAIKWTWAHREEAGEIYNSLRSRLDASSALVTETVDALSLKAESPQPQERTATMFTGKIVYLSGKAVSTSSATGTLSVLHKKPPTKHELHRIADTVLYYFT